MLLQCAIFKGIWVISNGCNVTSCPVKEDIVFNTSLTCLKDVLMLTSLLAKVMFKKINISTTITAYPTVSLPILSFKLVTLFLSLRISPALKFKIIPTLILYLNI